MSTPIAWPEAQRICDIPEVREALDKFAADACEENMLPMVSAIMGHASAHGRAAGLEEARIGRRVSVDAGALKMVLNTLRRDAEEGRVARGEMADALWESCIREESALSPTTSDAGKDDALELDAKRYRWLRNESWAGYNQSKGKPQVFETVTMVLDGARNFKCILAEEALDNAVDAARAAQGERG
ncbi:hypothetical protein [Herbaspirillum huttiense]|uniref:Uncharacterized protein n=2 Tax=Herbaspirillum huttiense TaxID=863372 RepID=A0AAJ2HFH2_9BURK|nr:hypothetical protein [Herbaspirillum huttiense]MDR9839411.1 hypothetical protein [Herbaspirillum huttiense]